MTGSRVHAQAARQTSWACRGDVVSALPITGNLVGTVMLAMPLALAVPVCRAIVGKDTANETQAQETVAELLNIVVGKATGPLETTPYRFTFTSPPSAVERLDGPFVDPDDGDVWVLPFTLCNHPFEIILQLDPNLGSRLNDT